MPIVLAIAFAALSCVHLYACYRKRIRLRIATKPCLLVMLAALYILYAPAFQWPVLFALLFGLAGDILLIPNGLKVHFVIGAVSFSIGVVMFLITFFHGDALAGIFSSDGEVVFAAADYLKAYAIDCLFTAIFFCYTGFYNGIGKTRFVMIQGILGAFCVRVPVSYIMSIQPETSLFHIGLATPMSSALQLILCVGFMLFLRKKGMLDDKKI